MQRRGGKGVKWGVHTTALPHHLTQLHTHITERVRTTQLYPITQTAFFEHAQKVFRAYDVYNDDVITYDEAVVLGSRVRYCVSVS